MSEAKKSGSDGFDWTPLGVPVIGALLVVVVQGVNGGDMLNPPMTTMVAVAALAEGVYMLFQKTLIAKLLTAALAGLAVYMASESEVFGAIVGLGLIVTLMFVRFFQKDAPHAEHSKEEHKPAGSGGASGAVEFHGELRNADPFHLTPDQIMDYATNPELKRTLKPEAQEAIDWLVNALPQYNAGKTGWKSRKQREEEARLMALQEEQAAQRRTRSLTGRFLKFLSGNLGTRRL